MEPLLPCGVAAGRATRLQGQTPAVLDAMADAEEETGISNQEIEAITDIHLGHDPAEDNVLQMSVVAPDVDMVIQAWRLVRNVNTALEQEAAEAFMAADPELKEGVAQAWKLLGPIARLPEAVWAITTTEQAHRADRAQEWQFLGRIAAHGRAGAAAHVALLAAQTPQQALKAAEFTNICWAAKLTNSWCCRDVEETPAVATTPAGQALDVAKAFYAVELLVIGIYHDHMGQILRSLRTRDQRFSFDGLKLNYLIYKAYECLIYKRGGPSYRAEARAAIDAAPDWQKIEITEVWHYITRSPCEAAFIEAQKAAEAAPSGQKTKAALDVITRHGYVQR